MALTPNTWTADELPASQSALNVGNGFSDDHMNLKVSGNGTLFAAVKTSYDKPGYPRIALLVRQPNGTWDNLYGVSEIGTRGIVVLNEQVGKIRIVYAASEDGGDILYKESAMSPISFSPQQTLISGIYNNPTSIKNSYSGQVVILASSNVSAVGVLATDVVTQQLSLPGIPTLASPADNATGISLPPALSWYVATNAATYQLQVATSSTFANPVADISNITGNSSPVSGLAYSTQYFWRVQAVNATGASGWSATRSFTTIPLPLPAIPTLVAPVNNATGIAISPTLTWSAAANAATYQVQLSTTSTIPNL